jgi:hypothetical protein
MTQDSNKQMGEEKVDESFTHLLRLVNIIGETK